LGPDFGGLSIFQRDYIHGAVKGHREAMFTAALQSLDGAMTNTNPNPNTNLTIILILTLTLTLFANPNRKIITLLTPKL